MSDAERERRRKELLAELDAVRGEGRPVPAELRSRIAEWAVEGIDRFESDATLDGRLARDLRVMLADLFASSGVVDPVPGSTEWIGVDGGTEFFVRSNTRGRVSLGVVPFVVAKARAADVAIPYAEDLEAKRRAPVAANKARRERKAERARQIHAEGKGWAYVVDQAIAEGIVTVSPSGRDGHVREPEEIHELAVRSLKRLMEK